MNAKVSIIKVTADGEQVSVEIVLDNYVEQRMKEKWVEKMRPPDEEHVGWWKQVIITKGETLDQILEPFFRLMDDRLIEMNHRVMKSNFLAKKLSPDAQYALHTVFEVLHGRQAGPPMEQVIKESQEERQAAEAKINANQPDQLEQQPQPEDSGL